MQLFNLTPPYLTTHEMNCKPLYIKSCLVISSLPESISRFNRFMEGLKTTWHVSDEYFENIRITVYEALLNAIVHGNKSSKEKMVYISALRDGSLYAFTVEDEGTGFDEDSLPDPLANDKLLKAGGRGIFIMKYLADAVHFSKNGKCVKLFFGLKKEDFHS